MEINLVNISKSFGDKEVIHPTTFKIDDGSFTTLLGPSGCGKTTLLRMIAGLETPDDGEIWIDDCCYFSKEKKVNLPPEKRNLAFVFQDFALWPHMRVFENVAFGLRATGDTDNLKSRVIDALKTVKLDDFLDRYPHELSGGQQQRVAFARTIVIKPGCILFDEPLSALDALLREQMRHELKDMTSSLDITSVFVTHDQTEAMSMSDKIAVLNGGYVEQYDKPEVIYHSPKSEFVARFVGKSNWIDENRLFRPTDATKTKIDGGLSYELTVQSVQYLGDTYELTLLFGDKTWTFNSDKKYSPGEKLKIFVDPKNIIFVEN
ncbi:ABC transporter ATP-binding protein [Peptoniphilus sp.]|jgi:iron(III) transport system ATP-binding protein|uniref:ABC transporter ATP-binding protein n=1 Tax=Peptoniphilus sp. TaxID=1971214 RepID=UPI003D89BBB6